MKNGPKTILVTGCAGFIGGNFVRKFQKEFPETTIIGLDDFSNSRPDAVPKGITFYKGSITDEKLIERVFKKHEPEYVFHFAAFCYVPRSIVQPVESSEVNIKGIVVLLKNAKDYGAKRFIFSSTGAIYGTANKFPTKETAEPQLNSPYALQKYVGERFCKVFSQLFPLDTVSLRYFNIYGPGQRAFSPYSTVMASWLEAAYFPKTKKAVLYGDGSNSRDFCYVDDVVDANIACMKYTKPLNGEVFNIGSGTTNTVNEVEVLIEKYSKKKLNLDRQPQRLGDAKYTLADISRAKKSLGYQPRVGLEEGLKRTVQWFKNLKN